MDRVGDERRTTGRRTTGRPAVRWTVAEAAELMGISAEAVRGRIRRGTLPVEREGGAVYVLLESAAYDRPNADRPRTTDDRPNADRPRTTDDRPDDRTELVEALREQISDLRGQLAEANAANRENRRIIAGLTQRIPELEAAGSTERPEAAETGDEMPRRAEARSSTPGPQTAPQRRSFWRRVLGR